MNVNPTTFLLGAARVIQDNKAWRASRMTAALQKLYSINEVRETRVACTTGIRLAMRTNSSYLKLQLKYLRASRPLSQCDVIVNDQHTSSFGPNTNGATDFEYTLTLPSNTLHKPHKVEIYLPHCREVLIENLLLQDNASVEPLPPSAQRWLAIGDSITQGMTATTPARTWTALVARQSQYDLHNIAVGGAIMQAEVGQLALELPWNIVTIAFGVNDYATDVPLNLLQRETSEMIIALQQRASAKIYLITPIPCPGRKDKNKLGLQLENYRKALRQVALNFKDVTLVEGTKLVNDDPSLFIDGVHPNDAGMAQFAEQLASLCPDFAFKK